MYLRTASFVLFGWLIAFPCAAQAQPTPEPRESTPPAADSRAAPADPGVPGPPPPQTSDYSHVSTGVHAPAELAPTGAPVDADTTSAPSAAAPGALDLRDRRYADAHVDRVLVMPTAETHPQGTFYVSSYEIIFLQAGYAVSDRTQISLTSMPPIPREKILPLDLSLKTVLVRAPEFRVAALGSVSGIAGLEEGTALFGRVGGVVQFCLERTCRSNVSVGTSVALAGPAMIAGTGAGLILRATRTLSVLMEFDSALPLGTVAHQLHGLAFASGIRLAGEHLGLDLGFARRIDLVDAMALPFIAATYRTGGS